MKARAPDDLRSAIERVVAEVRTRAPLSRRLLPWLGEIERARHSGVPLYAIAGAIGVSRGSFYSALRRAHAYAERHRLAPYERPGTRPRGTAGGDLPAPPGADGTPQGPTRFKKLI